MKSQDQEYCRTCLRSEPGVVLFNVENTFVQVLYQLLIFKPGTSVKSVKSICSECYKSFKICEELRQRCFESEKILLSALFNDAVDNPILPPVSTKNKLSKTVTIRVNCTPYENLRLKNESCTDYIQVIRDHENSGVMGMNEVEIKQEIDLLSVGETNIVKDQVIINAGEYNEAMGNNDYSDAQDLEFSDEDVPLIKLKNINEKVLDEVKKIKKEKRKKGKCRTEHFYRKVILSREDQVSNFLKRSHSLNYMKSAYRCSTCYKGFNNKTTFDNHMIKHDTKSGKHECDICHVRYKSDRMLKSHQNQAHVRYYQCLQCTHISQTASQARSHEDFHNGLTYECKVCGETFRSPSSLLTHVRLSHPSSHTCVKCGDSYVSLHGLTMHHNKAHRHHTTDESESDMSVPSERYCPTCDLQFQNVQAHKRHFITSVNHSKEILNRDDCIICGLKFTSNSELKRHVISHRTRGKTGDIEKNKRDRQYIKLQCDHCDQYYSSKALLQNHIKRKHLGIVYVKHVVCENCGKRFKSRATLKYHQRTHTGEKPYPCDECTKRFTYSNALKIHKRSHNGERPYQCSLCDMRFRQKPSLNRHMKVHTGAKPYQCRYCLKSFSQTNSLKLHIDSVHYKIKPKVKKKDEQLDQSLYE